jgi:hypothetical protein
MGDSANSFPGTYTLPPSINYHPKPPRTIFNSARQRFPTQGASLGPIGARQPQTRTENCLAQRLNVLFRAAGPIELESRNCTCYHNKGRREAENATKSKYSCSLSRPPLTSKSSNHQDSTTPCLPPPPNPFIIHLDCCWGEL